MQSSRKHNLSKAKSYNYDRKLSRSRSKKREKYIELRDILSNIY